MPSRYAEGTEVTVERSKAQLEAMLKTRGATQWHLGWDDTRDIIEFGLRTMQIRFILPRLARTDYLHDRQGRARAPRVIDSAIAQADRQRWRALYLVVRAKLEAVDAGISVFEEEFLAHVVTERGQTVGEILVPRLQAAGPGRLALPPAGL